MSKTPEHALQKPVLWIPLLRFFLGGKVHHWVHNEELKKTPSAAWCFFYYLFFIYIFFPADSRSIHKCAAHEKPPAGGGIRPLGQE